MKEHMYNALEFACKNSNNVLVERFLNSSKKDSNIDLLYKDGLYFNIAISHNNPSLVKILLDYMYDTKQIEKEPKDNNTKQAIKYSELQKILRESKKEFFVSKDIDNLISDIYQENDEDSQDNLSDVEATTGNDNVLWDDYIQGSNKPDNKYSADYKNLAISLLENMTIKHSSTAKAILATQEELSNHSSVHNTPSQSTFYNWIKDKAKIEKSDLTSENLQKLPIVDHFKELGNALQKQENKFDILPLTYTDNISQHSELKIAGESNAFNVHDTTDSV